MIEEFKRKAKTHLANIKTGYVEKDPSYQFAKRAGVYIKVQSSFVLQRLLDMLPWGLTARQRADQAYLDLRDVIKYVLDVHDRPVLEDIEEAFDTAKPNDFERNLLLPALDEFVRPVLALRRACNRTVIISIAGYV
jgi:hypothetical protein